VSTHKEAVGQAAISVLAEHGGRGLTHRAVDRCAGLPQGTTSRYARTRAALLTLAAQALFTQDSRAVVYTTPAGGQGTRATAASDLVEALIRAITALLEAPERYRARVELQLEAARTPELRRHFHDSRAAFIEALAAALSELDQPDARHRADILVMFVDGILHRQVVLGQLPLTEGQLRALLHREVLIFTDGRATAASR
jgi:DNA-binding transcriptional regulator YbjK